MNIICARRLALVLTWLAISSSCLAAQRNKSHLDAPLTLYPACPVYHLLGIGDGTTRVAVRIGLDASQRQGLKVAVEVADASGKNTSQQTTTIGQSETLELNFRLPVQVQGTYWITARLIDRSGKEIDSAKTDVRVVPREEARVTLTADGFLVVGGKEQFPIGMYSCGHYDEMARAGFTATHSYAIVNGDPSEPINPADVRLKQLLDQSWSNHMRMMVELPREAIEKARWAQVRRRIETFRHHPGLLCWGSEERVARGRAPLANIATLYRIVKELDPDHPLVLGDTKDVIKKFQNDRRDFFPDPCMDIGIWWWYPIPLKDEDGNGLDGRGQHSEILTPPSWLTTTISKRPLWIAIQAYQHPKKDARFPTPAEYRCMAYLSIINGVKGLFFYTGSGQKDYLGKPAGLLNKPEEGHWDYVQKLVSEVRDFSPVIMGKIPPSKPTLVPADAPVEFALREAGGKRYLIAANKSDQPQTVRFTETSLAGKQPHVMFENHSAKIEGGALPDDFGPYGVHIYRIE